MDNLIGKTLDGLYTIQELIGTGGMANVYKAVVSAPGGPVPEGTVVAVKVLRQELMHDADLVRRFKNESKAAAAAVRGTRGSDRTLYFRIYSLLL